MELTRIFTETRWKWIGLLTLAVLGGLLSLVRCRLLRYDGPEGLMLRVRSEFAPRRDHPQFVSTPLAAPGGDPARALALVLAASATPTLPAADPTPSPERADADGHARVTRHPAETDAEDVPRRADLPPPRRRPRTATPTTAPTDTPSPPPPPPPPTLDGPALPAVIARRH